MSDALRAGAAQVDVTPRRSEFLYGYPHVERMSTGVHDPLLSSALYLTDGRTQAALVSSDVIYISKAIAARVREQVAKATGIPPSHVTVSATHTHSGPLTTECVICDADPVVPPVDAQWVRQLEDGMVQAVTQAFQSAQPAQVALAHADATGIGTNRHDPVHGPADHQVPVLMVRSADGRKNIACMLVCSMHPTVLHEDSKLVSGDFPGLSRIWLQRHVLGADCPVLHQTGPAGNQSNRYVTKANTFEEAERIGQILAKAVEKVIPGIQYTRDVSLSCRQGFVALPPKPLPSIEDAEAELRKVAARLQHLQETGASKREVRTAECDWFGAEETVTLAKALASGRLEQFYRACSPGEVHVLRIGPWTFVSWLGEVFVEYGLALKARHKNTCLISCSNGDAQTYIVTRQANEQDWYEKFNAIFSWQAGERLMEKTEQLLAEMQSANCAGTETRQ